MNEHPTQEQWMDFLYGEADAPQTRAIEAHLQSCAPCRQTRNEFQQTRRSLDRWRVTIPERHRFATRWAPVIKWAAAAALLVTTALATARVTQPNEAELAARIEKSVQQKVATSLDTKLETLLSAHQQQVEQLVQSIEALREEDQKALFASLRELQARQALEVRRIRQSLETVAVLTDQSLKDAQRKLVQLASYTSPTTSESN